MTMNLFDFVLESNRIEGILPRNLRNCEVKAHQTFLELSRITIPDLETFVSIIQPGAILRNRLGLDVRIGNYFPPRGGPEIEIRLSVLLDDLDIQGVYATHLAYENLHPFTDGNGRSGRVLWLWQLGGVAPLGFLHEFYYQTLGAQKERKGP